MSRSVFWAIVGATEDPEASSASAFGPFHRLVAPGQLCTARALRVSVTPAALSLPVAAVVRVSFFVPPVCAVKECEQEQGNDDAYDP